MQTKANRKPSPSDSGGIVKRKRRPGRSGRIPFPAPPRSSGAAGNRRLPRSGSSYEKGYHQGYDQGFKNGFSEGYEDGLETEYLKI